MNMKCVLVGDGTVGKTSLVMTYATNTFPTENAPTIYESAAIDMVIDGQPVTLCPWDTHGQEDYDRLRPLSYPQTDVFLLLFSLSYSVSFDNISTKWKPEINRYCPNVPIILVGTKVDLRDEAASETTPSARNLRPVTTSMGLALAEEISALHYIECSARTKKNINHVFEVAAKVALGNLAKQKSCLPHCTLL